MTLNSPSNAQPPEPESITTQESQSQPSPNQDEPGLKYTDKFTPTHKWCPDCQAMLPHSHFPKNKSRPDGLGSYCRTHSRERQAESTNNKPGSTCFSDAKSRAARRGLEFTITYDEFIAKDVDICPYLGIPIEWNWHETALGGKHKPREDWVKSIDRIDSSKGYTNENVLICSWKANNIKGAASYQDLLTIGNIVKNLVTKNETTN